MAFTRKLTEEELAERSTPEYLAKRQANGFGTQANGKDNPKARKLAATRKLLSEKLDEPINPTKEAGASAIGLKLANLSRVDAALMAIDDALSERTGTGRLTENAMQAARFVLDHRYGRARQAVDVQSTTEDELLGKIDKRAKMIAASLGLKVTEDDG